MRFGSSLFAISCATLAAPAMAQPDIRDSPPDTESTDQALQEIVVTAQKRSENLQKVPIAVTSLSSEQLEIAGITNTVQIGAVAPGVNIQLVNANFQPRIRGIGTSAQGPGVENPVALYVDNVYYASQQFGPGDLSDVEAINVLKGPQGTLFGRNATGGVIQLMTRNPSQSFDGEVQVGIDNYLTMRAYGYVGGAISDSIRTGFSASYSKQFDGWGTNLADGRDVHRVDSDLNFRSKWIIEPGAATTIRLNLDYARRDGTMGLNFRPYPGTTPALPGYTQGSSDWDIDNAKSGYLEFEGGGAGLTIEQELGFARLVSITSYRKYSSYTDFAPTMVPILAQVIEITREGNQLTEELQLVSADGSKLKWVIGAFAIRSAESSAPLSVNLFGPFAPTPTDLAIIDIYGRTVVKSIAAFGQVTYEVAPGTNITGGLRYTYEHRSFVGSMSGTLVDGTFLGEFPLPPIDPKISFKNVSWRVAIDHQLNEFVMLYASQNRGFKSGGYNAFDPTNAPYEPERLDAFEVGIKSELMDRRLRVNLAGFYYDYKNIQVSRYLQTATIYNGGAARLFGVDLDFAARFGAFTLNGGLEWLDNEFTNFPDAQVITPLPGGGTLIGTGDVAGNNLPFASTFSGSIGLTYKIDMPNNSTFTLGVNGYHSSGYAPEADNVVRQKSYDLLGASAKWESADGNFSARLWANNLLNESVIGFVANAEFGTQIDYSFAPRTFGLTLTAKLGR